MELQEVRARIPELQAALGDQESLQDLHLALGDYLIRRDVIRDVKEDEKGLLNSSDGGEVLPLLLSSDHKEE